MANGLQELFLESQKHYFIDPVAIAEDEKRSVFYLENNVSSLKGYVRDFGSALRLRDIADQKMQAMFADPVNIDITELGGWSDWVSMAARDASMTIYHFGETLKAVRSSMKDLPSLSKNVDHKRIRSAAKNFKNSFPVHHDIRNAIAHAGELYSTEVQRKRHSFSGSHVGAGISMSGVENAIVGGSLNNRIFSYTFNNGVIEFEFSNEAFQALCQVYLELRSSLPMKTHG